MQNELHFHRSAIEPVGMVAVGVHEGDHVEEEAEQRRTSGTGGVAGQEPAALVQELPVARPDQGVPDRVVEADQRGAEAAEHEGEPDAEEGDEPEAEDGEVRAHHVGGVLGPAEAGLHEGEAGLHEDDERSADHHPQQVDLRPEDGDGVRVGLGPGDAGASHDEDGREREHARAPAYDSGHLRFSCVEAPAKVLPWPGGCLPPSVRNQPRYTKCAHHRTAMFLVIAPSMSGM